MPSAADCGSGSSSATTTRRMPASTSASAHGGVRPWWSTAPGSRRPWRRGRRRRRRQGDDLGVGAPGGSVAPSPTTTPSRTTTQPTHGLGACGAGPRGEATPSHQLLVGAPRARSAPALEARERRKRRRARRRSRPDLAGRSTPSPIRTLTVGSGLSPDRPHGRLPWARGLPDAGSARGYRRSGFPPIPEGFIVPPMVGPSRRRRANRFRGSQRVCFMTLPVSV